MPTSALESPPVAEVVQAVKPRLRGWLHAGAAPLALAAGIVLVALAPTESGPARWRGLPGRVGAAVRHQRDLPPRHLGTARRRHPAPAGPRQHLRLHRRHLHPAGAAAALRSLPGAAAQPGLGGGARRADLPAGLAVRAALALHRALPRDGLGRAGLAGRVLRQRRTGGVHPDPGRRSSATPSAPWSTAGVGPTRSPAGSASTRSSTPAPSPASPVTTWPSPWPPTPPEPSLAVARGQAGRYVSSTRRLSFRFFSESFGTAGSASPRPETEKG